MVTLKDPYPPKRSASILALEWITAPPSAVIAVGTVAARVQAWNDVINQSPLSPHGPSPPSKKHIKTRDGSDRGVRSSFGRRAEGSFGKPAGRSDRLAPEGMKNDGLPPVGGPHRASEGMGGLSSGCPDIEEHRLAGIIREMTFYDRSADRRVLGRSLDSVDGCDHWGYVVNDKQRGSIENRKRRTSNKHSLGVSMSADHNLNNTNESSPKSVIDELGEMIDEALAHHQINSAADCTTAEQIEKALAKHACRSSKHHSHGDETVNSRKRHPPREVWQQRSLEERDRSSKHQSRETTNQRKQRSLIEQWQQRSQEEQGRSSKYQSRVNAASNQRQDQLHRVVWQQKSRDEHDRPPKQQSQAHETIKQREQPSLSDESQQRSRDGHNNARMKPRTIDNFSSQTPLIARMAAEELAISEPSIPLDDGMTRSATSSSSSPQSRDHSSSQALLRRHSNRRRSSKIFPKPPATHDYPMNDLQLQRPQRLTIDTGTCANRNEGEEVGPGDTLTTLSSPGVLSTVSTWRTPHDNKHSRRHSAAFLSSAGNNNPTKRQYESDFSVWNRGRDQSSQGAETTTVDKSPPRKDNGSLSVTRHCPRQHTLSDIAGSEDQDQSMTDVPASTVTETTASTRRERPKPSVSSATSQKTLSPMAWPFCWRLALVDKPDSTNIERSQVSAVGSHESADPTAWSARRMGSGSNGADPALSSGVPGSDHDGFRRALKHSQSDPHLSQSDRGALRNTFHEVKAGREDQRTPLTRSRSASVTPKNRRSCSVTINRRAAHGRTRIMEDQSGTHQGEDDSIHIFSRRPSETTSFTQDTRESTYSAGNESTALVFVSIDDESGTAVPVSVDDESTTPVPAAADDESTTPDPLSVKDESTAPGPVSPKEEGTAPIPVSTNDRSPTSVKSPVSKSGSRRPSRATSRRSSSVTIKPEVNTAIPSHVSHPQSPRSNSAANEDDSRTRRPPDVAVVKRSSRRTHRHHHRTLSRHNRGEQSGSTIDSSRTFRTGGTRGLRAITIKVEIRTRDEKSETVEEQREDTLVVKAQLGKREVSHNEVSTESGSGE
jgi:hypothetical protein